MKIKPLGKRVLIKIEKIENKTKSGIILQEEKQEFENYGQIIEIGNDILELKIGDFVIFNKEKSVEVRNSNEKSYIVELNEIYAKVGE